MQKIVIIISFLLAFLHANEIDTFQESKEILVDFYSDNKEFQKDFYCEAPFKRVKKGFEIIKSKAYSPRNATTKKGKINQRTKKIEWEHIMSAHNFGQHLPCWKKGGRKACAKDPLFNKMESDIQNLAPAIGEINGDRSNFKFAQAPKDLKYTQYGNCRVYTDFKAKRFYPQNHSKGWIARSYLYMSKTYNIRLSTQERKLMEAWDKTYPMDKEEQKLREFAKKVQGKPS